MRAVVAFVAALLAFALAPAGASAYEVNSTAWSVSGANANNTFNASTLSERVTIPSQVTYGYQGSAANQPFNQRGYVAAHYAPSIAANTNSLDLASIFPATAPDGSCTLRPSYQVSYCEWPGGRPRITITFGRPVTNPVLHMAGIGGFYDQGGGANRVTYSATNINLSQAMIDAGATFTNVGGSKIKVTEGNTRIEATTDAPSQTCTVANSNGSLDTAGCGSVRVNGTFSTITLDLSYKISTNSANPSQNWGINWDGWNLTTTVTQDYGDAPASYDAGNAARHVISDIRFGSTVTEENANVANGTSSPNAGGSDEDDGLPDGIDPIDVVGGTNAPATVTIPISKATAAGRACAWIDFNRNGTFETGERQCVNVASGATSATFLWPARSGVSTGASWARFRVGYNSAQVESPTGPADSGEVEDYPVQLRAVTPSLTLDKSVDPSSFGGPGETLTYTFEVTNGPAELTDFQLHDARPGLSAYQCSPVAIGGTLPANGTTSCTATYETTQDDVDNGSADNTATATGKDPAGSTVTSNEDSTSTPLDASPTANPDETSGPQGRPQSIDPLANDDPSSDSAPLDPSTLTLLDEDGNPTDTVTVPGQGSYKVEDGKIVFTPEPDFIGTADPVDYRVADSNGKTAQSTYTPTVTPVAQPDETSGPQGQPQTVDPLANDNVDPDVTLDPSTLTLVDEDGNPTDTITVPGQGVYKVEDGKIVFTPEPQFTGEADPVKYQVKDSEGNTVESTYTPTVDPVTPKANPDETSGPQGQPQSIDPLANDEPGDDSAPLDPDSLTLLDEDGNPTDTVTVPGQGAYKVEDGKIVFTPEPDFTGTADPVKYQVKDQNGTPAESTYTPTVEPVTPKANPDETRGPQGQQQSVDPLANDEPGDDSVPLDPDSLTLLDEDGNPTDTVTVPGQGTYKVEDGKIVFTPEPQFTGEADRVKYQIKDQNGTPAESTYTPTVDPVAPTAEPDETSGPQGQPQSVDPFANDSPGDDSVPLDRGSLTLLDADGNPTDTVTVPGQGTYEVEDGKIVFTPEPGFIGTADPVDYRIADVNGTTADSTYTPTVTPVAQPDETSGPQGQPQSVDPLANDNVDPDVTLDPETLTLVDEDGNPTDTITAPGQGTYKVEDGKIVFTPEPQFTGTADPVKYQVKDSEGNTVESTYTPTVEPVTPKANPDETRGPQGQRQSVDPLANDEPGDDSVPLDPASLTLLDGDGNPTDRVEVPGQGVYTVEDGKLVFTPEPQFTGTADPVDYRIADENGTTADSTYTPTVDPVAPAAEPDETSGPQGRPQTVDPFANDSPGDDAVPLDRGSLTLLDGDGNPTDTVTVPGQGVYKVEDGKIVFTPEPDFIGTADPVDYRIADVNGTTADSTYTPTVTPVAQPDESRGPQGQRQTVDPLANDNVDPDVTLDPETLTLVDEDGNPTDTVTVPGQGVYTVEDGKIVFTPEPQFTGEADPVKYQVKDSEGNTVESTYTPTVDPVTPTAEPDETSGPQGQPQTVDPFENDSPGDDSVPLDRGSLTLLDGDGNPTDTVTVPGQGTYKVEDGKIVFTPEPQFTGTADPVDYRIADANGTTAESTYTPTVEPVTPTANPDETSGPQGQPQSIDPLANDEPGDDSVPLDPSTLTLLDEDGNPTDTVTVPGQGSYKVEDGKIVFTPEPQFTGTADPVKYQVKDENGTPAESTYTPTVEPVTPKANPDETRGPQGQPQSIDPLANDEPGDDSVPLDPKTLTLLDGDGNPTDTVTVPGQGSYKVEDGKIVFTPEPQFTGTADPVKYQVKDENGTPAESTYTPTVEPVTPKANPDETRGPQGQPQSIDPLANDEPGDDSAPLDPESLTLLDGDGNPVDRVEVPGQGVYTVEDGKIVFTPEREFVGKADPVKYQVKDENGTPAESTYTPTVEPVAPKPNPDQTSGPQGQPQSIDPLANDQPGDDDVPLDPDSLTLLDKDGQPVETITVPGQGSYKVEDGKIVFTPEPGFIGTADPVKYQVKDVNGTPADSTYTPKVTPVAQPDETSGPQGERQVVDPLANDNIDPNVTLDPGSLTLVDKDGNPTNRVEVPGQGAYTIEDGKIVFTPEPDFTGKADPVRYQVKDSEGNTIESTYTPTVVPKGKPVPPTANPDTSSGPQGQRQVIDPFANDTPGSVPLDRGSLTLLDKDGNPTNRVVVPGQGVYTIEDGKIVFTPEPQFTGKADPVRYRIKDVDGNPAESTYTPTVTPQGPPPAKPKLVLTKTANAKTVTAGKRVKYTIKVRNTGKGAARNVVVCDLLPKNVTVVARGGGKLKRGKLCFAKIATLAAGKSKTYRLTVRIDRDAPKGSQVNRATATADGVKASKASRKVVIRPKKAPTTDKTVVTG